MERFSSVQQAGGGQWFALDLAHGVETAVTCATAFLAARFSGAPRHVRRVGKIRAIELEAARLESARTT